MVFSNFSFASGPSRYSGMDITPKQFNALLGELKGIRKHLEQLRDAIKEHQTATENTAKAQQKEPTPAPKVDAELHLPKAIEDAITKQSNEGDGWKKANVLTSGATALFTALAFAAAFWYAFEAHKQTPKIKDSAEAAESAATTATRALAENGKQFRIDERPYLVKEYIKILKPAISEKLFGEVIWRNTGRTPALHGRSWIAIDILAKEPTDSEEWVRKARHGSTGYVEIGAI
jgi:hypothetical protein